MGKVISINNNDNEEPNGFTACVDCKNLIITVNGNPDIWYNHFCQASPRAKVRDPFSGELAYGGVNDFGGSYTTDEQYEYARNVNTHGACDLFDKKESTSKTLAGKIQSFLSGD
jgi:hypothetical protein